MKNRVEDLALFGGPPLFDSFRPTAQLANKGAEQFFVYARQAFDRRWLTNHGPLVEQLQRTLMARHGARHCIAFANGCMAIMVTLRALVGDRKGNVVLPGMSYRGLPHLVRWAGLEPRYCDIDPVRHTLSPDALRTAINSQTVAVLAVDNVNAMCDVDAIEAITERHGIPLLLDSVHGIGGRYGDAPAGTRGSATAFTLHATKLINGFEGGYVTTDDDILAGILGAVGNFGFVRNRTADMLGTNAKLNELHAALALANLPYIDELMAGNKARFDAYRRFFSSLEGVTFVDYSGGPGNYGLVIMRIGASWPFSRDETQKLLGAENALARPYYSPTLYQDDPEFPSSESFRFPVAEALSRELLQVPMGEMMSLQDIEYLATFFRFLLNNAARIKNALDAG